MPNSAITVAAPKGSGGTGADVYARIKEDILSNAYPAGFQIRESDLAGKLGTSRTPVREAIIRLEAEGLVEVLPRRGVRIRPLKAADMREIYDILTALESLAAAQIAARATEGLDLTGLFDAMEMMEAACDDNEPGTWAQGDDRFHRELLCLNDNARLIAITDSLYSQAHRTQMITLRMRKSLGASNREHRTIVTCIAGGDVDGARRAMRDHRQRGGSEMVEILKHYGLPPL
ncbi:MAG: GntR family transcriptional regulator [Rhodobacter sp.]|nr:GntR family transcriptional regulator [Rhodobacter sp.]